MIITVEGRIRGLYYQQDVRVRRSEDDQEALPSIEVFSHSEGKHTSEQMKPRGLGGKEKRERARPLGDLAAAESRLDYRSPTYTELPPRRAAAPRKRLPPPPRPRTNGRTKSQSSRREGLHYDPRPQDVATPTSQIYPIPIEFINQIPGVGQPIQQGSIRLDPETVSFTPSSHIEQIVNGIPKLVEESSQPFYLDVDLTEQHQQEPRSLHHQQQEPPIYREEYPKPQGTPYPPVPYHDTRQDNPTQPSATQAPDTGAEFRYVPPHHQVTLGREVRRQQLPYSRTTAVTVALPIH